MFLRPFTGGGGQTQKQPPAPTHNMLRLVSSEYSVQICIIHEINTLQSDQLTVLYLFCSVRGSIANDFNLSFSAPHSSRSWFHNAPEEAHRSYCYSLCSPAGPSSALICPPLHLLLTQFSH